MENTSLKITISEYFQLLVTAGDLRVQADEATGLVTQLTKLKASQEKLKEARIKYNTLRAQWEIAFEPAKLAYEKAVQLKASLNTNVDIPMYGFLEGKKHGKNNIRAVRIAKLCAELETLSADTTPGTNKSSGSSEKVGAETSGVDDVHPTTPSPASEAGVPDIPAPLGQVTVVTVPMPASPVCAPPTPSLATFQANKSSLASVIPPPDTSTFISPNPSAPTTESLGLAPLVPPKPAQKPIHSNSGPPAAEPYPTAFPVDRDPTTQTASQVLVQPLHADASPTPKRGPPAPDGKVSIKTTSSATQPPVVDGPSPAPIPHVPYISLTSIPAVLSSQSTVIATPTPVHTLDTHAPPTDAPVHVTAPPVINVCVPSAATAPDAAPHLPPPAGASTGIVEAINPHGGLSSFPKTGDTGALTSVNGFPSLLDARSPSLPNWGYSETHATPSQNPQQNSNRFNFNFNTYTHLMDQNFVATPNHPDINLSPGQQPQMTSLLGTDFVFNDMTLPGGQDHPGLSFNVAYNMFKTLPSTQVGPTPARRRKQRSEAGPSKHATAAGGSSFIMFTPATMSTPTIEGKHISPPSHLATSSATPDEAGKDRNTAPKAEGHDDTNDDDNEEALAKKVEKAWKPAIKLLPQGIPLFKVYVELINPLALSHFKHRRIDLPVTYMLDLPAKIMKCPSMWVGKAEDKLKMVANEWDQYLKDRTPMSAESKNLITKYASILPRALTYSREVVLYILTTSHGNIICPYHRWVSKKLENDLQFETHVPGHYSVTGVPGILRIKRLIKCAKEVASKVVEVGKLFLSDQQPMPPAPKEDPSETEEEDKPLERKPGELHCGCIEDEVLLELILWKSTLQQSPSTGIVETWQDVFLHPRDRTFVMRAYTFWMGLKADILYEYDAEGNHRDMVDITQYQIKFFGDRLERAMNDREDLSGIISGIQDMGMVSFDNDDDNDDNEEEEEEEEEEDQDQVEVKKGTEAVTTA
ncbi:hypothetical protein NP233_g4471 [Leucocoprinus birnbaumii]|uniref:Uncharacterized protein n=1 Tax=Leucocoprinus birnbaumii TaxID=56174 RepID=A0AAD5VYC0_9AGAR|nr:hypothetical protein NP233_g4471 [Leucocoprinus birnbaumii]